MKKTAAFLLALCMLFSMLCACASADEITAALERMIREAPSFRTRVEERRNKYTYAGLVDRLETDYQELA